MEDCCSPCWSWQLRKWGLREQLGPKAAGGRLEEKGAGNGSDSHMSYVEDHLFCTRELDERGIQHHWKAFAGPGKRFLVTERRQVAMEGNDSHY